MNKTSVKLNNSNSTENMENNQITSETESALEAITLQETRHMEQVPPETQNENLNDSLLDLSEAQLQRHLDSQTNEPDTETQTHRDMDQERQEIDSRLRQRWQALKQTANGSRNPEEMTEGGNRQYPPTPIRKGQNKISPRRKSRLVQWVG